MGRMGLLLYNCFVFVFEYPIVSLYSIFEYCILSDVPELTRGYTSIHGELYNDKYEPILNNDIKYGVWRYQQVYERTIVEMIQK